MTSHARRKNAPTSRQHVDALSSTGGFLCPICRESLTEVTDSRRSPTGVRRRRYCEGCSSHFTTAEVVVDTFKTSEQDRRHRAKALALISAGMKLLE